MPWSIRIGRIAGIDLKLHFTFALILMVGALQWGVPHGPRGAFFGVLLVSLLFVCVVLHELGHALMARRFGIPTRDITLLPIGGVAQLERTPEDPRQELWIAAAGPVVSAVLAAVLFGATALVLGATSAGLTGEETVRTLLTQPSLPTLLAWLAGANATMALFNLLPALPMDGGRIFRAALSLRLGAERATTIAAGTGQVLAVGMGLFGILQGHVGLALIGLLVFMSAGRERAEVAARRVLTTLRVEDAYNKHALVLVPGDRLSRVVEYLLSSPQSDFAVVLGEWLLGVLTRERILQALRREGPDTYVSGLMQRDVPRIDAAATLEDARRLMGERRTGIVAVYRDDVFLGLLGVADLSEALAVASAVSRHPGAGGGGVQQAA
ncbi:site-2 protease family protein [Myxococcus sp. RHSTA-1-4]|uniref:site-2 protease family protein n=1 Tax=Myxococcus sp. RHSTA-1-4 TaxID=2874601 RepID=UPI001CBBF1A5|nr:site-2 protease family protein [Myxococcus sp. RHSTA-1-4]MBZ4418747.1 site-2 protease family protein [Myxococcus sp. RHSTA-1-4]